MKVVLPEALHARPADVFVKVASRLDADVEVRKGDARANGKSILDVLRLGARAGDTIEIVLSGSGAEDAEETLRRLVERSFDPDLAPEIGVSAVPGIAIGNAVVVAFAPDDAREKGTPEEEKTRLGFATAQAKRDVEALLRSLPDEEAQLFEPELAILDDLAARMAPLVETGLTAEVAVEEATRDAPSDLVIDARARMLDALAGGGSTLSRALALRTEEDLVLVTDALTPSVVAALPSRILGIVASGGGYTSHAAILARSRDVPLAFVEEYVVAGVEAGDLVALDTTSDSRVWIRPGDALLEELRSKRAARIAEIAASHEVSIAHLRVALRVNVASVHDVIPAEAQGIGLVRTELVFAGRRVAPTVREQTAVLAAIARKARAYPVVVRLFDAGGDKPVAWLPDADAARGIALLFTHEEILAAQLEAISAARAHGDVQVLLPLTRGPDDVRRIKKALPAGTPVGAMIETKEAAAIADAIADASDFVCIGTNDLAASAFGIAREAAATLDSRVLDVVRDVVVASHARGKTVSVCGELAADPKAAVELVAMGIDALSMAPSRLPAVRLALSRIAG